MRKLLTLLIFMLPLLVSAQTVMSWNIQYLGEAKYKRDTIVPEIARVMQESNADIIAVQELVTNKYGDSCIIQIASILNYNYIISEKTTGQGTERYAYLYDTSIVMNYNYLDIQRCSVLISFCCINISLLCVIRTSNLELSS